jgi:hypothetical protein
MLELLLYCHMFANMRCAGHIAAVMDFLGSAMARCRRWRAPVVRGRTEPVSMFECWVERELMRSLDRLDAYVTSMA